MARQGSGGWREPFYSSLLGSEGGTPACHRGDGQVTLTSTSSQCRLTWAHPQHRGAGWGILLQPSGVLCDFRAGTGG